VGNYEFGAGPQDISLMQKIASVAGDGARALHLGRRAEDVRRETWENLPT
jgi:predicted component of type VI protein secretion system